MWVHFSTLPSLCCGCSVTKSFLTLCDPMECSLPGSSVHGNNVGVGRHFLLQGIYPTQGSNLHLLTSALAGGFFTTSDTREGP